MGITTAEKYRQFISSPAINSAKYFFKNLLKNEMLPFEEFILKISTGKTPPKSISKYYKQNDVSWFKPSSIGIDIYLDESESFVTNVAVEDKKATLFNAGTLLITCIGDIGRVGILRNDASSNQQITGVLTKKTLLPEFAYLYLVAHREIFTDSGVLKTTLPIINQSKIKSLLIKVPPMNIQKAVVGFYFEYIKSGLPNSFPVELELHKKKLIGFSKLVDSSKKFSIALKTELTHQQALLKKLRQQILQEAIEGKLTADWRKQNPDVEPASELLKRIQAEKAQLIKDKKIKNQKPLPPIGEDEKPFILPVGWVWCRINDLSNIGTGATPLTSEPSYYGGDINWMTSGDTRFEFVTHTKTKITNKAIKETNCQIFPPGTLVVAMYGQGKTRGQVTELKINAATNQACVAIQLYLFSIEANQFLKTHFKKIYNEIRKLAQGGAQPNLNMGKIKANIVALPPLPEQKAIVTKVEKLLALCDQLETKITNNQNHAEQLMQAVLKEAFSLQDEVTEKVSSLGLVG